MASVRLDSERPTKVATPDPLFWIIKVLSIGMGETTSEFFIKRFEPTTVVVAVGAVLFGLTLALQLTRRRFVPWVSTGSRW